MNWLTVVISFVPWALIAVMLYLLHLRISFLETRLIKLAEAHLHLSHSIKLLSEIQEETTKVIRSSVEAHRESQTA
jgi:hypothetical protein